MLVMLWWKGSGPGEPPPIDADKIRARIVAHYEEAGTFALITEIDAETLKAAVAQGLQYDQRLTDAVLKVAGEFPDLVLKDQVERLRAEAGDMMLMIDLSNAESAVLKMLLNTIILRRSRLGTQTNDIATSLMAQAESELQKGIATPRLQAAARVIKAARDEVEADRQRAKDKQAKAHATGLGDAAALERKNQELEQRLADMEHELAAARYQIHTMTSGQPSPPTTQDPNRRNRSR